jgi:hypothetical protein
MKNLFLFIGVILYCLFFSCKKDSTSTQIQAPPPPPVVDSFLLHPPPVLDSLPISFTAGSWWKYQRIDSGFGTDQYHSICCVSHYDSTIELITAIGNTIHVDSVFDNSKIPFRKRYDTVNAFMLEVKNLTNGNVDTNYVFYYNAFFIIYAKIGFNILIKVPLVSGTQVIGIPNGYHSYFVDKNSWITVLDKLFDNCIQCKDDFKSGWPYQTFGSNNFYLKQSVGIVYWENLTGHGDQYSGTSSSWGFRRLIDSHIAL